MPGEALCPLAVLGYFLLIAAFLPWGTPMAETIFCPIVSGLCVGTLVVVAAWAWDFGRRISKQKHEEFV